MPVSYPECFKPFGPKLRSQRDLELWRQYWGDAGETLTRSDDLTFGPRSKLAHKMCYWILGRYAKNGGGAHRRFLDIREKCVCVGGGGQESAPPFSARVVTFHSISFCGIMWGVALSWSTSESQCCQNSLLTYNLGQFVSAGVYHKYHLLKNTALNYNIVDNQKYDTFEILHRKWRSMKHIDVCLSY